MLDALQDSALRAAEHSGTGGSIPYVQSERFLALLLEYLACPLDSSPLAAVRGPGGQLAGLGCRDHLYPVAGNVPCMIPDVTRRKPGRQRVWRKNQDRMGREAQTAPDQVFTGEDDSMGQTIGRLLAEARQGLYLDVGCGMTPCPGYMATSGPGIQWIGIDPFLGDAARSFPFAQAMGEYLPFRPQVFDGILYASTIYHLIEPLRSLRCSRRLLKPGGRIWIWFDRTPLGRRYLLWRAVNGVGIARAYNADYPHAFTLGALTRCLAQAGFALEEMVWLCEKYCTSFPTCEHRSEYLAVAS